MKSKKEMEKVEYYVCGVCGNTVEDVLPEKCPICNSPKEKFFKPHKWRPPFFLFPMPRNRMP